jgi:hypothetical protein
VSRKRTTKISRRERPVIKLPDDDLVPRRDFASEIGVSDKTAKRLNLPTTYVGNVAYVLRGASLKIIADKVERPNQPTR